MDNLQQLPPKKRRYRRSLLHADTTPVSVYNSGKRCGPKSLLFSNNDERDFILADQYDISMVWILLIKYSIPQNIPSWTGFHQLGIWTIWMHLLNYIFCTTAVC